MMNSIALNLQHKYNYIDNEIIFGNRPYCHKGSYSIPYLNNYSFSLNRRFEVKSSLFNKLYLFKQFYIQFSTTPTYFKLNDKNNYINNSDININNNKNNNNIDFNNNNNNNNRFNDINNINYNNCCRNSGRGRDSFNNSISSNNKGNFINICNFNNNCCDLFYKNMIFYMNGNFKLDT